MAYCGDDRIAWAGYGGVWMYDVKCREMRNIFFSRRDIWICGCEEGVIRCVARDYGEAEREADLITLACDGTVLRQAQSEIPVRNGFVNFPAWSKENFVAISSSVRQGFPLNMLYLLNEDGQVLAQEWIPAAEDNGGFYCGDDMFIKVSAVGSKCVNFYQADTLEPVEKLDSKKLVALGLTAPPTFAWNAPDHRIFIGSWDKLFVFRIG